MATFPTGRSLLIAGFAVLLAADGVSAREPVATAKFKAYTPWQAAWDAHFRSEKARLRAMDRQRQANDLMSWYGTYSGPYRATYRPRGWGQINYERKLRKSPDPCALSLRPWRRLPAWWQGHAHAALSESHSSARGTADRPPQDLDEPQRLHLSAHLRFESRLPRAAASRINGHAIANARPDAANISPSSSHPGDGSHAVAFAGDDSNSPTRVVDRKRRKSSGDQPQAPAASTRPLYR